ncbi:MAG: Magnesium chelatase, subunit ChlI C-terminal, partial [Sedimentibacter sp.]|nr:Magnesium chelatase, subunit ChlI C-terminal [Sedimentibacter sp.]
IKAREIQRERYKEIGIITNSELGGKYISIFCKINSESEMI